MLKYIREQSGRDTFEGLRILVIHSGGDSKRVPQYSACGKLFSPVPRQLPDGRRSTLFDELIIGMSLVPSRIRDGMLTLCGDVLLIFNPLQIDFDSCDAAVLSIKENVETGKDHGVYTGGLNGNVADFCHKLSAEKLSEMGAIDESGNVNIDTGAVIFSGVLLDDLYSVTENGKNINEYVNNKVRLSFYADFLYPLAENSTLEKYYKEVPEGAYSDELTVCRTAILQKLNKYKARLLRFSPASFIHFGTTGELLTMMTEEINSYRFLDWSSHTGTNVTDPGITASNSYVSCGAVIGNGTYIGDSNINGKAVIGENRVLSCITAGNGVIVPDGTVLHGLKLSDGRFVVRMYSVHDNPKEAFHFGEPIATPLWNAPLFPVCDTAEEALLATLLPYLAEGKEKISLMESFVRADVTAILPWQCILADIVDVQIFLETIDRGEDCMKALKVFTTGFSKRAEKLLMEEAERSEFSRKIRIYYYTSRLLSGEERDDMCGRCFDTIRDSVLESALDATVYHPEYKPVKDEVKVNLPVRINFGGGWSDTPPYCNENGGLVLNAAVSLDGELPIEVIIRKTGTDTIVLASTDSGTRAEFSDISELQDCRRPSDSFALHKAALIASGLIPVSGTDLSVKEITKEFGSGIYLSTCVHNIPRGSGLGTSSILAGACIKAIFEFIGVSLEETELYTRVLCMEQIMSTGGGWQDQVGGIAPGIKVVSAEPGQRQIIHCAPVNIKQSTLAELNRRFCVIYTGQRRLARNLLREVMGRYIGNNSETLSVLYEIQRVAVLMRFELEKGNLDGFAKLLSEHWELSKRLDNGCTNTCIDQIFLSCDDLIDGKMICGAGGGGFLQVVLKKDVTAEMLRERIHSVFADSGVEVRKCEFVTK